MASIIPFGVQTGLSLGFEATGEVTREVRDRDGTVLESTEPFAQTFALGRRTGSRWLNVGVLPATPEPATGG